MKIIDLKKTPTKDVIATTCQVLAEGGLILFPTETTYGAGVDATNPAAVEKLLNYKSRREGKPLSIAVDSITMAEKYVQLNDSARRLYAQFLPGPVTVVSASKNTLAPGVASEFGTVGVRIPDYDFILELLTTYQKPLTATSANGSGKKRPYSIQDVFDNLSLKQKQLIDLVLDAGQLPPNPPSTVIDTTHATPVSLRPGTLEQQITGSDEIQTVLSESEADTQALAGKLLLKHWDTVMAKGLIIGLDGQLGTGKTIFTKGVAAFLGIKETLTSPTYTYLQEYEFHRHSVKGKLYHLDVWKIESAIELTRLDWNALLKPGNVIVVEWWQQIAEFALQPIPLMVVTLTDQGPQQRQLSFTSLLPAKPHVK